MLFFHLFLQKRAAVGIEVENGAFVAAQDGSRALFVDLVVQGVLDGLRLGLGGDDAEQMLAGKESRASEGEGEARNTVDLGEATVVDLLHAAHFVKLDGFHGLGVVEIGNPGIVEGDVSVFADAHHDDVGGIGLQKLGVTGALSLGVDGATVDEADALEGNAVKDVLTEETAEALIGIFFGKADVFVHVERVDAGPVDVVKGDELFKHLVLGGSGGKDHVDLFFFRQQLLDLGADVFRGESAHLLAGVADLHKQ